MATLYELKGAYREVYEMDDVDEQVWYDTLDSIQGEIEEKADGYAKLIKEYKSEAKRFETEAKRLQAMQKVYENRAKHMEERLFYAMNELQLKEIPNDVFKIKIQANGGLAPLKIKEGVEIPEEYQIITRDIDNAKIREALKTQKLDFAELGERGTHLVIR